MYVLLLSRFSRVRLCVTPQTAPTRLPCPWDSPGKNTGVGCHFLLQCMKVKSESEAAQSCLTLSDPMDCSLPGSSIHGILQARVGCHALLQGTFLTQGLKLYLLCLLHWQVGSLPLSSPGKPRVSLWKLKYYLEQVEREKKQKKLVTVVGEGHRLSWVCLFT